MTNITVAACTSIPVSWMMNMHDVLIYIELPALPIVAEIGATNLDTLLSTPLLSSKL